MELPQYLPIRAETESSSELSLPLLCPSSAQKRWCLQMLVSINATLSLLGSLGDTDGVLILTICFFWTLPFEVLLLFLEELRALCCLWHHSHGAMGHHMQPLLMVPTHPHLGYPWAAVKYHLPEKQVGNVELLPTVLSERTLGMATGPGTGPRGPWFCNSVE